MVLDRGNSVRSLRRVSWPWELLVGGVGGVMALLLGYSIICLVEVFYFFIVRWTEQCIDPTLDDDRRRAQQEAKESEQEDPDANVLWRTASDTDLVAAGNSVVRWDSPILKKRQGEPPPKSANGVGGSSRPGTAASSATAKPASARSAKSRAGTAKNAPSSRVGSKASLRQVSNFGLTNTLRKNIKNLF